MTEDKRYRIIYEDDALLVVFKSAGIAVQTRKIAEEDLESILRKKGSGGFMAPITRLDQPVEGLVLFAKTKQAADHLTRQLKAGRITKIYEASVYGTFGESEKEGVLKDRLYRSEKANLSVVLQEGDPRYSQAKDAELHYKEISPGKLRIHLITGRHHQIRVQLSEAGHPILGDLKYGTMKSMAETEKQDIRRLMLTAKELHFVHPVTGQKMDFSC